MPGFLLFAREGIQTDGSASSFPVYYYLFNIIQKINIECLLSNKEFYRAMPFLFSIIFFAIG